MRPLYFVLPAAVLTLASAPGCDDDGATGSGGAGGGTTTIDPAAGGVRRLTSSQLQYSTEYLLGSEAATLIDVWTDTQLHGFEAIGAAEQALGPNDISNLESVITRTIDVSLLDPSHVATFAPCVMQSPTTECYAEVATAFGRVAWRRPVEEDERARLVAIGEAGQIWGMGDFDTGLKYELMAILQSPNFVYIVELGEAQPSGSARTLTGYELASRMSFFLTHRTPDVELLDAAEAGRLTSSDGIRDEARRLLATPEARRALDRYYSELFLIRDLTNLSKDPALYPQWNAEIAKSMQEELLRFFQDIVWTRDADARELFTSNETFVDSNLALLYGVTPPAFGWTKVTLPEAQSRLGLLGRSGFLTRFAHPTVTSPTRRGRFFWEKLACEEIPPPPQGVDTTVPPEQPGQQTTMRQRLEGHKANGSCASCHDKMDSVGLAFEHFDAMGQYRETDDGLQIITADDYGSIGAFEGPADLARILHDGDAGAACMVKNLWRQSMGHLETDGEAGAIALLEGSFAEDEYRMQSLLISLCESPAFRQVGEPK